MLPLDRPFALARPGAPFDPERPAWLPKRQFLVLMTDERLATLKVAYDDASAPHDRARRPARGRRRRSDRSRSAARIEGFFERFMGARLAVGRGWSMRRGHAFTDNPAKLSR